MVADKKRKRKKQKLIGIGLWTQRTGHNPILLIMYRFAKIWRIREKLARNLLILRFHFHAKFHIKITGQFCAKFIFCDHELWAAFLRIKTHLMKLKTAKMVWFPMLMLHWMRKKNSATSKELFDSSRLVQPLIVWSVLIDFHNSIGFGFVQGELAFVFLCMCYSLYT